MSRPRIMVVPSALVVLVGCAQEQEPAAIPDTDGSTTPPADAPAADSTAGALDPACIDDYHGNQAHAAALDLLLDTTDTAFIALGDGIAADPPELGGDQLVVCTTAPSDFFTLTAECPGYLAIEARALEGGVTELLLYEESFEQSGEPVDRALGDWSGFFLNPRAAPAPRGRARDRGATRRRSTPALRPHRGLAARHPVPSLRSAYPHTHGSGSPVTSSTDDG